ncbi:Ankyrin-3 [Colletotrichum sp. SAR 10_76]|nr:Ankyrin-3 [Colletotrichum sp. SAR 10_76]
MANVNIPSPVEFVADNNEDVIPEAARAPDDNISHGASVLRKFIEDLEKSDEGAKEVGMFRHWVDSMVDDGIEEGLDMKDRHYRTLLHVAAIEGLFEIAKRLIDKGAVLDARDEWGDTPLIDACGEGDGGGKYLKVVKLLLDKGAKADICGNENESPLYRAAINGHSLIVQYLLANVKWDLDFGEDIYNMTPLHAAASAEDSDMVRYLRDKGARLDLRDTDGPTTERLEGWTAIEWAAFATEPQALWLLIANSPQNRVTKEALKSAKDIVEKLKNKNLDQLDDTAVRKTQEERDEAYLFDRFSELRERLRSKSQTGSAENNQISLDDQLAEATREAEKLSRNVRDILDELSMLQATVQYQENVQKTMNKQSIRLASHNGTEDILETSITATDNINDIKRLTIVAERILATIDTTLSLHQSEIANLQAGLAMQEGRVLMVFTVVTIFYRCLS